MLLDYAEPNSVCTMSECHRYIVKLITSGIKINGNAQDHEIDIISSMCFVYMANSSCHTHISIAEQIMSDVDRLGKSCVTLHWECAVLSANSVVV